jgi:hypothetical protein
VDGSAPSVEPPPAVLPSGYHLVDAYRDLKGRFVAAVKRDGVGETFGHSWSSHGGAVADAVAYLRELPTPHET